MGLADQGQLPNNPQHPFTPTLNVSAWEQELASEPDASFLLSGIKEGFKIVDVDNQSLNPAEVEVEHYRSATSQPALVEKQLRTALVQGHYEMVENKPTLVSALGAIPKSDGNVRLIHDCSNPSGKALDDYAEKINVRYQKVRRATSYLMQGCYFAKINLKSAYRSVGLHPSQFQSTGLK